MISTVWTDRECLMAIGLLVAGLWCLFASVRAFVLERDNNELRRKLWIASQGKQVVPADDDLDFPASEGWVRH